METTTDMKRNTDKTEFPKSKVCIIVEFIHYVRHAILSKTIIKKTTGNILVSAFDAGEEIQEKVSPFDMFVQVIDGAAEIFINDKKYKVKLGEGLIIPAHARYRLNANEQFKMISTIIKSGYEDFSAGS